MTAALRKPTTAPHESLSLSASSMFPLRTAKSSAVSPSAFFLLAPVVMDGDPQTCVLGQEGHGR